MERVSLRLFADRSEAGRALAYLVQKLKLPPPFIVLGLARGGVPVAYEVAQALNAPLDVLVVRKIGMPGQPELAIGAIASGNIIVREPGAAAYVEELGVAFDSLVEKARQELERREQAYRSSSPRLKLSGKTVVLVDDGLATGATMLAAVRAVREAGAAEIVVAAPIASSEAVTMLKSEANAVAILRTPPMLLAIGEWYENFDQVSDSEVRDLLTRAHRNISSISQARQSVR